MDLISAQMLVFSCTAHLLDREYMWDKITKKYLSILGFQMRVGPSPACRVF